MPNSSNANTADNARTASGIATKATF